MKIKFMRVLGVRSAEACVMALADGCLVRWQPRYGWECTCPSEPTDLVCSHIDAVCDLLDPRVTDRAVST